MEDKINPFSELSQIFVDNQRVFSQKCKDLSARSTQFADKLNKLKIQIDEDPFSANLNLCLSIQEEASLILAVAKEVEFQREKILSTLELLKKSNQIKLNKN